MSNDFIIYLLLFFTAIIGGSLVFVFKTKFAQSIQLFTSFSGAFLLAICILHLMPEIFSAYTKEVGIFILVGFLLQVLLEFFSDGIEHGHYHSHTKALASFPYAIFLSLCVHSFVEGMALVETGHHHGASHNDSLLIGILIHKIPVAIVLGTMLLAKKLSKLSFVIGLVLFALSAPAGLFIASYDGLPFINNPTLILALAVGIFLHISTTILFESSEGHRFDSKKFFIVILGFTLAVLTQ